MRNPVLQNMRNISDMGHTVQQYIIRFDHTKSNQVMIFLNRLKQLSRILH